MTLDDLLARALLVDEPTVPRDVVPGPVAAEAGQARPAGPADRDSAGQDLLTLCETVVTHTAAASLRHFDTARLPEPPGAQALGCILRLALDEDGARFWWQYAAGAGDDVASYCLYLHHLSVGETDLAAWWRQQTRIDTRPDPQELPFLYAGGPTARVDTSTPTVLRVLHRLAEPVERDRTAFVDAVLDYVPDAVATGYLHHPDFEIPLPGPDFADRIGAILSATAAYRTAGRAAPRRRFPVRRARGGDGGPDPAAGPDDA